MRILLAQINTTVGAVEGNLKKIIKVIQRAKEHKIDLVVFPELTIPGYPPKDLLDFEWFIENNKLAIEQIAKLTDGIGVIVGFADTNPEKKGKSIFNSAAFLYNGQVIHHHHKCLLPTYDVFDEGRYFEAATQANVVNFKAAHIGIAICEDIWNDKSYWTKQPYKFDPVEEMAKKGIDVLIAIHASPFYTGKRELKNEMLSNLAKRFSLPIINVNLVGGNDGLIFDGASTCFDRMGEIVVQARDFCEDFIVCEYENRQLKGLIKEQTAPGEERIFKAICLGLKDYVSKCGFKKVVIGLSGGIDSAVTAAIAAEALGKENVIAASMPSKFSSHHSVDDARTLAKNLGIKIAPIPIQNICDGFTKSLEKIFSGAKPDITEENIQARIRGTLLMALANKYNLLVLATGNKSELAVGYCTLYGDMCGAIAPLGDVPKTLVYKLAHYINRKQEIIPKNTIEKPPSAELRPDQKDTDSLPPYNILDPILNAYIEEHKSVEEIIAIGLDEKTVRWTVRKINLSEYKRQQAPIALKITSKAFGYGRRFPIATEGDFVENLLSE